MVLVRASTDIQKCLSITRLTLVCNATVSNGGGVRTPQETSSGLQGRHLEKSLQASCAGRTTPVLSPLVRDPDAARLGILEDGTDSPPA